jgi:hypothetical protein
MDIGGMLFFRAIPAVVTLLSILASAPCGAETRSGFWVHLDPSAIIQNSRADFSELSPFCSGSAPATQCSLKVADVDFEWNLSVKAPGGIEADSALGAAIQTDCLSGKSITLDREGLFYLDSMMKKHGLTAPVSGYADSCPARQSVYFLKTSENLFATLVKVGEYIGGIDREYYYWAYQPENDSILHKATLYEQPESLSITVDAFSGRPNPMFTLKDSAGIAEIVRQIYLSVNTLLDSSIKRTVDLPCNQGLGYRLVSVTGMYGPDNPPNTYMPMLEICNSGITYYKASPFSSSVQPRFFQDPNRRLEKLIIRVCCRLGLVAVDSVGEVRFCDIIPDSLKDENELWQEVKAGRAGEAGLLRLSKGRIVFSVQKAGAYSLEVLDTRGRRVGSVEGRCGPGEHAVELNDRAMGAGVFLVRFRMQNSRVESCVPLITD